MDSNRSQKGVISVMALIATVGFIIISVVVFALASKEIIPLWLLLNGVITTPIIVTSLGLFIWLSIESAANVRAEFIFPVISFIVAIVSAIIGLIMFINDHNFIMRGFESEIVWFSISIPALLTSFIHLAVAVIVLIVRIKKSRKAVLTEE